MVLIRLALLPRAAVLLTLALLVAAHGDEHETMDMPGMESEARPQSDTPDSYYNHAEHKNWMYAHILLMTVGWTIILPVAVFISVARSRIAIPAQLVFLVVNALGIFTSIVYDAKTPDLYHNNAHHKIGWAVTWIAVAWSLLSLLTFLHKPKQNVLAEPSHPVSAQAMAQYQQLNGYDIEQPYRWSADSGHDTDTPTLLGSESRNNSSDLVMRKPEQYTGDEEHGNTTEGASFLHNSTVARFATRVPRIRSPALMRGVNMLHTILELSQLLLAFLAILTGFATWWGIFRPDGLLNGLAHWIKGGIFFWYGLLTLGRWMGAFTSVGWAWNIRPQYPLVSRATSRLPSAEFVESFVIFLYGATNVFLEHLTSWGKEWSPMDLEHLSITIMFFGGGLMGMAVESTKVRELLNTNVLVQRQEVERVAGPKHTAAQDWQQPRNYATSLNPLPALVIFLLGLVMSGHSQDSMTSTMVHKQWGMLFTGFALSRLATYALVYLRPPTSYFPSRPPTELLASFCLTAGGMVFMASTRDVVKMLDRNGLHAMFVLTVVVGFTCLLMVWTVVLYAIKGWAAKRERR